VSFPSNTSSHPVLIILYLGCHLTFSMRHLTCLTSDYIVNQSSNGVSPLSEHLMGLRVIHLISVLMLCYLYEGASVSRSQMDIKRKTCDIITWKKKHLFPGMSSTNIDTLVPLLHECIETHSIKVF
jgi:hypothetical protein